LSLHVLSTTAPTNPGGHSHAISTRLVNVSLAAIGDAVARTELGKSQKNMLLPAAGSIVAATVIDRTASLYKLQLDGLSVKLDLPGTDVPLGTKLRLRLGFADATSAAKQVSLAPASQAIALSSMSQLLSHISAQHDIQDIDSPLATAPMTANPEFHDQLAKSLEDSITTSGLFYESHLKDWAHSQRALSEVIREPQAKLGRPRESMSTTLSAVAQDAKDHPVPAEMLLIVQRQFSSLETNSGIWRMEVWPGQFAELIIQHDSPSATPDRQPESTWRISIKMQLPNLCAIDLSISLFGDHPAILVTTDENHTETFLASGRQQLIDSLAGAGFIDPAVRIGHEPR
jgi:Flagellar hook-length control protein FliK